MPVVQTCELASIEAKRPTVRDEEEDSLYSQEINYLEQMFEEDLFPTMRYSFVVFLHTVFETRLRGFCVGVQRQRKLPVGLTDLHGSPIDQASIYLRKLVGISVTEFPEWMHLRRFQDVRDCIVHSYGYLNPQNNKHECIRRFASKAEGISITSADRICLSRMFCEQHLANIAAFFNHLFDKTESNL